jgi:hypothetical protein
VAAVVVVVEELVMTVLLLAVQVALAVLDKFWFTTKMWAAIKNTVVEDYYIEIPYEEMLKDAEEKGYTDLVEMTLENSPAYLHGKWDGKVFTK